ncbi:hypothetical protein [Streptomyces klenkii]|uniref:hypothetical protein n=1 Tax=Streptomyces klenkii TaxID=1420899 RepID=UPI003441C56A
MERDRGEPNQAAVAKVIDSYVQEIGERDERLSHRSLKDRVSRALSGVALSSETLRWFIGAFGMNDEDEANLWAAFTGASGPAAGISHTIRKRREMVSPQRHRTGRLIERYVVDAQGLLIRRCTYQSIRAVEDGVDIYIFNHESEAAEIQVLYGGILGRRYEYGGGLCAVEIVLDSPLQRGEAAVLEYRTGFHPGLSTVEVRRPAFARAENIDMAVEFQGGRLPKAAWRCVWGDHFDSRPVSEESTGCRNRALRQHFPFIEDTVVGFRWEY